MAFDQAIADKICDGLADGIPLASLVRADKNLPRDRTVRQWRAENDHFDAAVARARESGHEVIAADALRLADECLPDNAHVAKARLQVETRLKLLACWDPGRYGQKVDVTGGTASSVVVHHVLHTREPLPAELAHTAIPLLPKK